MDKPNGPNPASEAAVALAKMRTRHGGGRPKECECGKPECWKCRNREYKRSSSIRRAVPCPVCLAPAGQPCDMAWGLADSQRLNVTRALYHFDRFIKWREGKMAKEKNKA